MAIEIYNLKDVELEGFDLSWSLLWWEDLEEAGVRDCWFAFDDDDLIGFQSVNADRRCIAIEVAPGYQGQGVASMLVEASGCWKPDRNECPEFWAKMEEKYGCQARDVDQ